MAVEQFEDFPFVSLSNNQRKTIGFHTNFIGTVNNGIPKDFYKFVPKTSLPGYLAFIGRIHPSKMPDWAIQSRYIVYSYLSIIWIPTNIFNIFKNIFNFLDFLFF